MHIVHIEMLMLTYCIHFFYFIIFIFFIIIIQKNKNFITQN